MNKPQFTETHFSHRKDATVPAFQDEQCVVFVDGNCGACSAAAKWISRQDKKGEFLICPINTELGTKVLNHYGLSADDPDSWLYLEEGTAFKELDAVIKVALRLGGILKVIAILSILPTGVKKWIYQLLANNRYRLFGKQDICAIHDPELQKRLIGN